MNQKLFSSISSELNTLVSNYNIFASRSSIDKLYEAYILSCIVTSLKSLNCELEVRDNNDTKSDKFLFRLKPGYIFSPNTASSFILIHYEGAEYELHSGLRVMGKSDVLHELDVAIVTRKDAKRCRNTHTHPRQTNIKFLAECKYYGSTLPLSLGREYIGLCTEFSIRAKTIAANVSNPNIKKLLKTHQQTTSFNLTPNQPKEVEHFIGWITKELEHVL